MKICRFDDDRLGIVDADAVLDVTGALDCIPSHRWPLPQADLLLLYWKEVLEDARARMKTAPRLNLANVRLLSPVANPPKVIAAPVNYLRHQAEANADGGVNFELDVKTIEHYGLFLKSSTAVVGPSEGITVRLPHRRTDHEIELVVVIGTGGSNIPASEALAHVAGYTIGLDMTLRGSEDRSLRKSLDSFAVVGPWLATRDEVENPNGLELSLAVNGEIRQRASTRDLIFNVERLIAYASSYYRLSPGDVIYTGTPEGVGPVRAGDCIDCSITGIGAMQVRVRGALA